MSYTVWANGQLQSIVMEDLDDAKCFAYETNMDFVIKNHMGKIVYTAAEYEFSPYFVEVEVERF